MPNLQDHDQFAPPRTRGRTRSWALAAAAHGLLVAAMLWTVRPPKQADEPMVEAEFWSTAAPAPALPVPAPPPPPAPEPVP
ncbi:protein TolA, partial [Delftia tsuruhatensis]|nr:protein TolA [Delftia sp.]